MNQPQFALFRPEFTWQPGDFYTVYMRPTKLRATSASQALAEARAMGVRHPIVGPSEVKK